MRHLQVPYTPLSLDSVACACSAVGRDLFAYITLIVNPAADAALNRIFKTPPRGLADKGWATLRNAVRKAGGGGSLARHVLAGLDDVEVDASVIQTVRPSSGVGVASVAMLASAQWSFNFKGSAGAAQRQLA